MEVLLKNTYRLHRQAWVAAEEGAVVEEPACRRMNVVVCSLLSWPDVDTNMCNTAKTKRQFATNRLCFAAGPIQRK